MARGTGARGRPPPTTPGRRAVTAFALPLGAATVAAAAPAASATAAAARRPVASTWGCVGRAGAAALRPRLGTAAGGKRARRPSLPSSSSPPPVRMLDASGAANGDADDDDAADRVELRGNVAVQNVIIIGSGPAGYTAAIYAARANLKPLLYEGFRSGPPGGQLVTTADVENFPGFPAGITGPALMASMREQAVRNGAELITDDVTAVDLSTFPYTVHADLTGLVRAHSLIIATGATARRLGLPSEGAFWSRGISACAICDGAAPIFAGQPLAVVGGGDSACEEAVYLTKYGSHVHLLVRGGDLARASAAVRDRALYHPAVTVHYNTELVDVYGSVKDGETPGSPLRGATIRTRGEVLDLPVRGVFYAIGHNPNTSIFRAPPAGASNGAAASAAADTAPSLRMDDTGYILTQAGTAETGVEGVFAAGDVADKEYRQAVFAAGMGCVAALGVERFLTERGLGVEFHSVSATQSDPDNQPASSAGTSSGQTSGGRDGGGEAETSDDETTYDLAKTRMRGQYALRKLYHESPRPVVVKYVSPSCGPCRQLKPILNAVIDEFEGLVHFVTIDIATDGEVAESAGVTGTPTVQVFFEKALVATIKGVKMKSTYRREIKSVLATVPAKV